MTTQISGLRKISSILDLTSLISLTSLMEISSSQNPRLLLDTLLRNLEKMIFSERMLKMLEESIIFSESLMMLIKGSEDYSGTKIMKI
jgi:hypothetical protein